MAAVLDWAQSPWFDLAEGDFPYPSAYIPYSLNMGNHELPPWPLQHACHAGGLDLDLGVTVERDAARKVAYSISYGGEEEGEQLVLDVDWDVVTARGRRRGSPPPAAAARLLNATRAAVAVWFNVSGTADCFDAVPAINAAGNGNGNGDGTGTGTGTGTGGPPAPSEVGEARVARSLRTGPVPEDYYGDGDEKKDEEEEKTRKEICQQRLDEETVWTSLVCNEEMNQIITFARGMGDDFFWPPSYPRGTETYADVLALDPDPLAELCADPDGIFGYPSRNASDPWATWLDDYYGGTRMAGRSNILFTNGLLDPWSAGGVYARGHFPRPRSGSGSSPVERHNVTADGSVVSVTLDLGGHHLDLMFSDERDPPCASEARDIADELIGKWIEEWTRENLHTCV